MKAKRVVRHWPAPENATKGCICHLYALCGEYLTASTHCAVNIDDVTCRKCQVSITGRGGPPKEANPKAEA